MTKEQFLQRSEFFKQALDRCLEHTRKFRDDDPALSKPGAVEEYEKLNAASVEASNAWFDFCSAKHTITKSS
jgi:hypothetical protein